METGETSLLLAKKKTFKATICIFFACVDISFAYLHDFTDAGSGKKNSVFIVSALHIVTVFTEE